MRRPLPEYLLSIDVSLDRLDSALQSPQGDWLFAHRDYTNNWPGFLSLKHDLLDLLPREQEVCLTLTLESTAWYWWPVSQQLLTDPDLSPWQVQLALQDPQQVKRFRGAVSEQDKTDRKDPHLIARRYRALGVEHFYALPSRYLPLRQLTRSYHRTIQSLAAEKASALALLYPLASEYVRTPLFQDRCAPCGARVLTDEDDLEHWAQLPLQQVADQLQAAAHGHLSDPQTKAQELQQALRDSYPCSADLARCTRQALTLRLQHIRFLEQQQRSLRRLIQQHLDTLPEAQLALHEPGLGPILVAGCLSEIHDTRRFLAGKKQDPKTGRWRDRTYRDGQASVAKLAGLWWPCSQSGRAPSQHRPLARHRNPHLRYWFCQAAYCLKIHQDSYATFYWHKHQAASHHPHQRALILTARKAARLLFALLFKGQQAHLPQEDFSLLIPS